MVGSGSAWIQNFWLDPDAELGKFRAGPGSGINYSEFTTLLNPLVFFTFQYGNILLNTRCGDPPPPLFLFSVWCGSEWAEL